MLLLLLPLLLLPLPIVEINNELRSSLVHGAMQTQMGESLCFFSCPHEKISKVRSAKCKV